RRGAAGGRAANADAGVVAGGDLAGADPGIGGAQALHGEVVEVVGTGDRLVRLDLIAIAGTAIVVAVAVANGGQHFLEVDVAEAAGAGHRRVHQPVLPAALGQAEEEIARRHVGGRRGEARTAAPRAGDVPWRDQRGLRRGRWPHLVLALFEAFFEQASGMFV